MNILAWFMENVWANNLMLIFTILVLGYALGRIKVCGLDLGTAGVLLVALVPRSRCCPLPTARP